MRADQVSAIFTWPVQPIVRAQFEKIAAPLNRRNRRQFKAAGGGEGVAMAFVESLHGATFPSKSGFTALDAFMRAPTSASAAF